MIGEPRILVLTGAAADGAVFHDLLGADYGHLEIATEPADFGAVLDRVQPHVLVVALRSVADAERVQVDLVGRAAVGPPAPYRTLLLVTKDDLRRAYALCRDDVFDDYVLFWPMTHDATRLAMSVRHALRFLEATRAASALPGFVLQARRVGTLDATVEAERTAGAAHARRTREAIEAVGSGIRSALDDFGRRMIDTGLDDAVVVSEPARVIDELERLDHAFVAAPVAAALEATEPLVAWIDDLPQRLDGELRAARELDTRAAEVSPLVLVVDDDDFMRKLLLRLLQNGGYAAQAVDSAAKAIAFLRTRQPDLILMDVRLPDVDGIQLTRQLKALEAYASIPIVMLTGEGQRQVFVDSREAGAADFIVKPFDRDTLLKKVAAHLSMPPAER